MRLLHDGQDLIVALYAADENIQSSDAFDFSVGPLALHVTATAKVTPDVPGLRAKIGYDEGTGLAAGANVPVRASRCDTPKDDVQRCGSWSGSLTLRWRCANCASEL